MVVRHRQRKIDRRQQKEHIRLNHSHTKVQPQKDQRNTERHQRKERDGQQISVKHIRVQPDRERQHARAVRNDLDRQQQRIQPPYRPQELLDVREAILPRTMVVVVNKRHQGKTQWHHYIRGGRLQPRNQSQKIAEQNEQEERGQITNEPLISVPDNLLSLVRHKLVCHLGEVLHSSRLLDTQRHPHQDEVGDKHQKHQQLHRKCIRNRRLRRGRVHMQSIQKRRHGRGKVLIQESGKK